MDTIIDNARDRMISKLRTDVIVYEQWLQDNPNAEIEAVREVRRRLADTKKEILDLSNKNDDDD